MAISQLPIDKPFNEMFPTLEDCLPYVRSLQPQPFYCCMVNMSYRSWLKIIEPKEVK